MYGDKDIRELNRANAEADAILKKHGHEGLYPLTGEAAIERAKQTTEEAHGVHPQG